MNKPTNIAEVNISLERGVSLTGQFLHSYTGLAVRRPGFFFFQGLTRFLPPLKRVGSLAIFLW